MGRKLDCCGIVVVLNFAVQLTGIIISLKPENYRCWYSWIADIAQYYSNICSICNFTELVDDNFNSSISSVNFHTGSNAHQS
jgi:hypothetical protein